MQDVQCKNCQWYERYAGRYFCEWPTYNLPHPMMWALQDKGITCEVYPEESRTCGTYRRRS